MNVLDEHISIEQYQLLKSRRISVRHIGYDVGRKGMKDDEIIPFLRRLRYPTFFTIDDGFCDRKLCHEKYCLVRLDVHHKEVASFVRRFLGHPEFDTQAKRMGIVVRISRKGLWVWYLHAEKEIQLNWPKQQR